MVLFAETEEKIFGDIMMEILNGTNLSRTSPGSKMRALAEATSKKIGYMWTQFDLNIAQAFIDGADSKFLNYIGDLMGVERLGEKSANVSSSDRNIRFYVDLGTFGDINSGNSIILTQGTLIGTTTAGGGIQYRVIVNTVLAASDNEAYIAVQSVRSGSNVNVGAGQLKYHNFSDYTDSINDSLKVTNDTEIIYGQDIEGDINYRYRITNQILNLEKANATAIRLAALVTPGVADIIDIPYHRGIGTYDLMIKSVTPSISDSLIANVQEAIDGVTSQGINPKARGPKEMGISLSGTIYLKRKVTPKEQDEIVSTVTDNVSTYINNLDINEEFVINQIIERVLATSDNIKTIGTSTKPLDNLFLYSVSKLEDNKVRSTLLTDYQAATDERIIVENVYAGSTPIVFRIGT